MRVLNKAAALLLPVIGAAALDPLPGHDAPAHPVEDDTAQPTTFLWQNREHSSVRFEAPCHGCDEGVDDRLVFDLTVHRANVPCGFSEIELNGKPLLQDWDGIDAWGSGTILTDLSGLGSREITANWQSLCLFDTVPEDGSNSQGDDVVQLLTFTIHQVGAKDVKEDSGFTVSFKQQGQAEILRLDAAPLHISHHPSFTDSWRDPPPHLQLPSNSKHIPPPPFKSLEDEIGELQSLQSQVDELKWQIRERKSRVAHLLKQDVRSSIERCDGVRCVFQTLLREGPRFFNVMTSHFHSHGPSPVSLSECHSGLNSTNGPSCPASPSSLSAVQDHHPRPHFRHPPPHRRAIIHTIKVAKTVAIFISIASFITLIFRKCLCSQRQKVERAIRREERRNQRAYRRAARRHRWSQWWSRYRRPRNTADYEEKRALILEHEDSLEDTMQMEITTLRRAHELVSDLVRAEEGRMYDPVIPSDPVELDGSSHSFRRSNSLPSYRSDSDRTDPPGYEEELGEEIAVVDGFQYTSVTSTSTDSEGMMTPDSSVIDVSPRLSAETGRTTLNRELRHGTSTGFLKD